jgi:hypothetical protein
MRSRTAISAGQVRALCERRGDPVTSSVYLDVACARRPVAATYEQAFEQLAGELSKRARATGDPRTIRSVEGDLDAMRAWLGRGVDRGSTCGVALFSCSAQGYFEAVELDVPVRDEATIASGSRVRQLVERLDEPEPFLVALVDRDHLRLLRVDDHRVEEEAALVTPHERAVDTSIELGSWEHHDEEAVRTHHRRAAHTLDESVRRRPIGQIVVGGPDDAVAELERLIHPTTAALIVGRVGVRVADDPAEIASAARVIAERAERQREADLVEAMRQRVAGEHGAATGLQPTLDALAERRVATLLVRDGFSAPGGRCPACGYVGSDVRQCPMCGAANVEIDDVVEVAIEEAITQSAAVEFCRGTELDGFGSIAVIERF